MPDAATGPGLTDPHGLGPAIGRLANGSRKTGAAAFMVLVTALEPDEKVEHVVQCRFRGADGAMALTDRRLLVVNARAWEPDIAPIVLAPGLTVKGWQDERNAALVFERDGHELVVDSIGDLPVAQALAAEVRNRIGG